MRTITDCTNNESEGANMERAIGKSRSICQAVLVSWNMHLSKRMRFPNGIGKVVFSVLVLHSINCTCKARSGTDAVNFLHLAF